MDIYDVLYCLCCCSEIPIGQDTLIKMVFQEPGQQDIDYVACICSNCTKEWESLRGKPIVESLVSAKITRLRTPERMFTP